MKKRWSVFIVFFSTLLFANMANPYVAGTVHSSIYAIKNTKVAKEFIQIKLVEGDGENQAAFTVTYHIDTDANKTVPLVFIGAGLMGTASVQTNGKPETQKTIHPDGESFLVKNLQGYEIKYTKDDAHPVPLDNLIYFDAHLKKRAKRDHCEIQCHFFL